MAADRRLILTSQKAAGDRPGAPVQAGNTPGAFKTQDADEGAGCCGGCVVL
jgi:hypothetical protein